MSAEAQAIEARPEPSSVKLAMTLFVAGLLSGLVLFGVFELTKPTIKANQRRALERAVYKVVPGAASMQKLVPEGKKLVVPSGTGGDDIEAIYAAYDEDGRFIGYAIPNEGAGFADTVKLIFGYDPVKKVVTGMEVLESRETPGLGDKIYKDQKFVDNFKDLAVEPQVVVTKKGRSAPHEVDAITGATISSRAVVKIINEANKHWLPRLPQPGREPPLSQAAGGAK
jgi:electron transport complex protein RnfG